MSEAPSTLVVRVYFEDTDFSGRVYHGAYVRFLERGRTELLRAAGIDHRALAALAVPLYFTLTALSVTFHGAAFIDDLLTVETRTAEATGARFALAQSIARDGVRLASADVELCLIDAGGRPRRPPAEVREALAGLR